MIDWFRQLVRISGSAGGLFVSGGSMANLTALVAARHTRLDDRTAGRGPLLFRSDAFFDRPRAARDRISAGADSAHPVRCRVSSADGRARAGGGRGSRGRPAAIRGDRQCRHHEHGRDRSAARDRRVLPRQESVDARGRRVWRGGGDQRARPGSCWTESSSPIRCRSIRTNGCFSRSSAAACCCATRRC